MEYFIQTTAENEENFSGEDIVKENHISPLMFMTTPECYAPQLDLLVNSDHNEHVQRYYWFFNVGYQKEEDKKLPHLLKSPPSGKPYLGGGNIIARVWAFKKFEYAFGELLKGSEEWSSAQSIYTPLLIWSVTKEQAVGQRFVLKGGMIGLDYEERFFSIPSSGVIGEAPFIHFPGQPIACEEETTLIVANLTCYAQKLQNSVLTALTSQALLICLTSKLTRLVNDRTIVHKRLSKQQRCRTVSEVRQWPSKLAKLTALLCRPPSSETFSIAATPTDK